MIGARKGGSRQNGFNGACILLPPLRAPTDFAIPRATQKALRPGLFNAALRARSRLKVRYCKIPATKNGALVSERAVKFVKSKGLVTA